MNFYRSTWRTSNSYMRGYYKDEDLNIAINDIIDVAEGNRQQGDIAHWVVYDDNGNIAATGYIDDDGSHDYNDEWGPSQYYHNLPCLPINWD